MLPLFPALAAIVYGAGCVLVRELLFAVGLTIAVGPVVIAVTLLGLFLLNYPFLSWQRACVIGTGMAGGLVAASLPAWQLLYGYWSPVPWSWMASGILLLWIVCVGISLCGVAVRRRYWPVYPDGQCKACGYDLYGLTSNRCPECGQVFVYSPGLRD